MDTTSIVQGSVAREINRVVVHHSASAFGDVDLIREWHLERGWKDIGYHYVILNGRRSSPHAFHADYDGLIERGRHETEIGAHAKGHNGDSLGVCLIGGKITRWQYVALLWLLREINQAFAIGLDGMLGHYELDPVNKALCPGFDMELVRGALTTMTRDCDED